MTMNPKEIAIHKLAETRRRRDFDEVASCVKSRAGAAAAFRRAGVESKPSPAQSQRFLIEATAVTSAELAQLVALPVPRDDEETLSRLVAAEARGVAGFEAAACAPECAQAPMVGRTPVRFAEADRLAGRYGLPSAAGKD